ncbi:MAG: DUF1592 domain-containing protein [Acidobacteria bacterium]|nr:DUF1592 domain-containing protein [Acidobacteriota bacterium]
MRQIWQFTASVFLSFPLAITAAGQQSSIQSTPASASQLQGMVKQYCLGCHNDRLMTAGLSLESAPVEQLASSPAIWEKVVLKLRAGQMPPMGLPRPDAQSSRTAINYLESELDRAAAAAPNPGRTAAAHRLNRAEYTNAIRDLLELEIDAEAFLPADDSSGFDNNGDLLSISPVLMEKYINSARRISQLAVGNTDVSADTQTYDMPLLLIQDDRMSEQLPFGSRGGVAIRHHFPVDGEYGIKLRLQRTPDRGYVRGISEPHFIDVRLDGERLKLFSFGGEHKGKAEGSAAADSSPPDPVESEYQRTADAGLDLRVQARAGTRLVQVAFLKEGGAREGVFQTRARTNLLTLATGEGDETNASVTAGLGSVTISGPFQVTGPGDTPSRGRIFMCQPSTGAAPAEEEDCARRILGKLAHRAFRGNTAPASLDSLVELFRQGRQGGLPGAFDRGIELAVQGMLVMPQFLFRVQKDPEGLGPNQPYRISDLDLASRLSFFLWSSIPDEALLEVAESGKLHNPEQLRAQVRRMIADPRSRALVENFAGQWLYLRNVKTARPNQDIFSDFDENLRAAFEQETNLFLDYMIREDRPALDLLRSDFTFVNERLARHYGITGVHGGRFRKVPLADLNRRGLLGQGSILTVTALANRTSPVMRGKWVLENFLGTPPPDAPPSVPALKDKNKDGKVLTMRQQMEQHRANPACASCHRVMDPLGFALENFDAVGKWRTSDSGGPIDPTGTLPDGTGFQGPAELQQILLKNPEQFVQTVTRKLLAYSLGRELDYYDGPAVRRILKDAQAADYRWSALIMGIVESMPFQMRRSRAS